MKRNGMNDNIIGLLADQGFINKDSLSVLEVEDIPTLKVKQLAQRILLERMLRKKQPSNAKTGNAGSDKDVTVANTGNTGNTGTSSRLDTNLAAIEHNTQSQTGFTSRMDTLVEESSMKHETDS